MKDMVLCYIFTNGNYMLQKWTIGNNMVQIDCRLGTNYGAIRCTNGNIMVQGQARLWVKSQNFVSEPILVEDHRILAIHLENGFRQP